MQPACRRPSLIGSRRCVIRRPRCIDGYADSARQRYIGEPDMLDRGHGSAFVRAHCDRLFAAGAPAIGTDPHPDNGRAIRACEKAGFKVASAAMDTRWGRALLMERWR
ncbi:MAG TPA: GNAT family N-acetyltransferase [Kofleriaceae bacterium]